MFGVQIWQGKRAGPIPKKCWKWAMLFSGEARDLRLSSICLAISAFYSVFDTVYVFDIPYINVITDVYI